MIWGWRWCCCWYLRLFFPSDDGVDFIGYRPQRISPQCLAPYQRELSAFLAVVFLFNAAAYLVQEADVLSRADSWLAWTLLAPLIIYCNVFLAKSFDFFFLDLDTE